MNSHLQTLIPLALTLTLLTVGCGKENRQPVVSSSRESVPVKPEGPVWKADPTSTEVIFMGQSRVRAIEVGIPLVESSQDNSSPLTLNQNELAYSKGKTEQYYFSHHIFFVDGKLTASAKEVASVKGRPFCALAANLNDDTTMEQLQKNNTFKMTLVFNGKLTKAYLNTPTFELDSGHKSGLQLDSLVNAYFEYEQKRIVNQGGLLFYCGSYHAAPGKAFTKIRPITHADAAKALGKHMVLEKLQPQK